MRDEDDIITKAKLEIEGEWYETAKYQGDYKCPFCDLHEKCSGNINVYKICRQLETSMYFKKVDNKN